MEIILYINLTTGLNGGEKGSSNTSLVSLAFPSLDISYFRRSSLYLPFSLSKNQSNIITKKNHSLFLYSTVSDIQL